jgi:hypothetical protein
MEHTDDRKKQMRGHVRDTVTKRLRAFYFALKAQASADAEDFFRRVQIQADSQFNKK